MLTSVTPIHVMNMPLVKMQMEHLHAPASTDLISFLTTPVKILTNAVLMDIVKMEHVRIHLELMSVHVTPVSHGPTILALTFKNVPMADIIVEQTQIVPILSAGSPVPVTTDSAEILNTWTCTTVMMLTNVAV